MKDFKEAFGDHLENLARWQEETTTPMREVAGRWVPLVPIRMPIDVRWACSHRWTPHVHDNGMTSHNDFDCLRCGVTVEAGARPLDGPWRLRSRIARFLWRR